MLGHEFIATCHFWKCICDNTNETFHFTIIVQGKIQLPLKGPNSIFNILILFSKELRVFLKKAIKCFPFYPWHLHFQSGTLFSPGVRINFQCCEQACQCILTPDL